MKNYWIQKSPFSKAHTHKELLHIVSIGLPHWQAILAKGSSSFNYRVIDFILSPPKNHIAAGERISNNARNLSTHILNHKQHKTDWIVLNKDVLVLLFDQMVPATMVKTHGDLTYHGTLTSAWRVFSAQDFQKDFILIGGGSKIRPTLGWYAGIEIRNMLSV